MLRDLGVVISLLVHRQRRNDVQGLQVLYWTFQITIRSFQLYFPNDSIACWECSAHNSQRTSTTVFTVSFHHDDLYQVILLMLQGILYAIHSTDYFCTSSDACPVYELKVLVFNFPVSSI